MTPRGDVLVVEDDPRISQLLTWKLREAGYPVTVAADGLAALRAFDTAPPALVTLDLTLPAVSGFRLIHLFKRDRPEIPVLVVSGLTFEEAEEVARAGADDFLTKPIDLAALLRKVEYFIHRHGAHHEGEPPGPERRMLYSALTSAFISDDHHEGRAEVDGMRRAHLSPPLGQMTSGGPSTCLACPRWTRR
jgi:DNA-binding response OmpR family regulator